MRQRNHCWLIHSSSLDWRFYESELAKLWSFRQNGMNVVMGFRARVLQGWDATNVPLENERAVTQVEHANPGVGAGSVQTFVNCRLGWTSAKGVYFVPVGAELLFLEKH